MRSVTARIFATSLLLSAATACSPTIDQRGNAPPQERLELIKPGTLTKSDVMALIGSPSSTSNFSDDTWYYISNTVETYAFYAPKELERQIIQIDFDKAGKVKQVRKLGLEDGNSIDLVTRETPAPGQDLTVWDQLMGNMGKFNRKDEYKPTRPGPGGGS